MISNVTVPDDISFEQAIQLTQELLQRWEPGKISEVELEQWMTDLMKTQNGARGFFVTALSDARNIFDPPTPALIKGLKSSPARVGELMTKNLAMSSAMIIHHQRHQDLDLAQGSENVRSRSQQLIQALNLPVLHDQLQQLRDSIVTGTGSYTDFLQRWGYDPEQKAAILQALDPLI